MRMMSLESYYSTNKILELIRANIFAIILISVVVVLVDYKNFFGGPAKMKAPWRCQVERTLHPFINYKNWDMVKGDCHGYTQFFLFVF